MSFESDNYLVFGNFFLKWGSDFLLSVRKNASILVVPIKVSVRGCIPGQKGSRVDTYSTLIYDRKNNKGRTYKKNNI